MNKCTETRTSVVIRNNSEYLGRSQIGRNKISATKLY